MNLPIYMDNASTTRTDPRVVEAMLPFFTETYGNSASRNHAFGWAAEAGVDRARAVLLVHGLRVRHVVRGHPRRRDRAVRGRLLAAAALRTIPPSLPIMVLLRLFMLL